MKTTNMTKMLAMVGLLLIIGFVATQVMAQIQLKDWVDNDGNNDKTDREHVRMMMISTTCGLVGVAMIIGAHNISLDFNKARLGTSILGTVLLISCVVLQVIAQMHFKNNMDLMDSKNDDKANKGTLDHARYSMLSDACGILSIAILSGSLQL